MAPGGRLHVAQSDLLTEAGGVALHADDAEWTADGEVVGDDQEQLLDQVRWQVAEAMFKVTLAHARAKRRQRSPGSAHLGPRHWSGSMFRTEHPPRDEPPERAQSLASL